AMGGARRRVACSRGDGGPSAWLVDVMRRSVGGEPRRRRTWTGERSTDAVVAENLGDILFPPGLGICQRRTARPRDGIGRAPRRGSLATTSGRPARVVRLCGGGSVADVIMATAYGGPGAKPRCTGGAVRTCNCRSSRSRKGVWAG